MEQKLLSAAQVALTYQIPMATLAKWRFEKKGPPYHKLGRRVMYRPEDLEEYLHQHRRETKE